MLLFMQLAIEEWPSMWVIFIWLSLLLLSSTYSGTASSALTILVKLEDPTVWANHILVSCSGLFLEQNLYFKIQVDLEICVTNYKDTCMLATTDLLME